jgi:hypothetical protein
MQFPVNFLCQRATDAVGLLQFFDARGAHAFQAAKPCQQTLPPLGADTGNLL